MFLPSYTFVKIYEATYLKFVRVVLYSLSIIFHSAQNNLEKKNLFVKFLFYRIQKSKC
jgi:hypothetical protein